VTSLFVKSIFEQRSARAFGVGIAVKTIYDISSGLNTRK